MLLPFRGPLVGLLLAAASLPGRAQTPVPTPLVVDAPLTPLLPPEKVPGKYKTYLYQRYTRDREASAVTHLFGRKQRGGIVWLATGLASITWLASQTGTRTTDDGGTRTVKVSPVGWGMLVGLFGGVGLGKIARFSNARLYKLMLEHERNFPFPYYVTKRVRDRDYEATGASK